MKKAVWEYTLGMCQRFGIAEAVMEASGILILDEQFIDLKKNGVQEIRELVKSITEKGKTITLSSHYPSDIDTLCDTA